MNGWKIRHIGICAAARTPQGFRRSLLCRAHEPREVGAATDDAMLVEMLGEPVRIVAGEAENKVNYAS